MHYATMTGGGREKRTDGASERSGGTAKGGVAGLLTARNLGG